MSLKAKIQMAGAEIEFEGSEVEIGRVIRELIGSEALLSKTGRRERSETRAQNESSVAATKLDERIFREMGADVALQKLPTGPNVETDAMVLLAKGLSLKLGQEDVPATRLMKALKLSGLQVDRLDRIAKARPDLFGKSGERRGSRYRLTTKGAGWAQVLLKQMESL